MAKSRNSRILKGMKLSIAAARFRSLDLEGATDNDCSILRMSCCLLAARWKEDDVATVDLCHYYLHRR
ncbi:hypothetical protein ACLOJK_036365 [Asimina triloba]